MRDEDTHTRDPEKYVSTIKERDKGRGRDGRGWREGRGEKSCPQKEEREPGRSHTRQRERLKEIQKKVGRNSI